MRAVEAAASSVDREAAAPAGHGAYGRKVVPLARNQRRRLLRSLGVRVGELDPTGRLYLDLLARLLAKIDLLDEHFASVGLIGADGELNSATRFYVSLSNSARLTAARLEDHLRRSGVSLKSDPLAVLIEQGRATRA